MNMARKEQRDGDWIDKMGACKVCDGEIPYGHTANCHIWKLEQETAKAREELEQLRTASFHDVSENIARMVTQARFLYLALNGRIKDLVTVHELLGRALGLIPPNKTNTKRKPNESKTNRSWPRPRGPSIRNKRATRR